jgi:cell division protein FtsA
VSSKNNLVTGLDVGSCKVRCVAALFEKDTFRIVGYGESPSAGWFRGRLIDQRASAGAISKAHKEAEKTSGLSIESAVVGFSGPTVNSINARGVNELGHRRDVDQRDINRAVERACRVRFLEDQMLLQVFTQYFLIDRDSEHRDPRGIPASLLEANVHLVLASRTEHDNLVGATNTGHLIVEDTVFEPVAAALAAVLKEDREEGVALVDIGMHSTSIAVYYREALLLTASLPISADHFTRDVAAGLNVSYYDADRLKREYGCAVLGLTADTSLIEVPSPDGRDPREAERRYLNMILEARSKELFTHVGKMLSQIGMTRHLGGGVLLTGGGAMLPGMCDMAESILKCQARNGLPVGVRDLPDQLNRTNWTTATGLAMYSARLKVQERRKAGASGLIGRLIE